MNADKPPAYSDNMAVNGPPYQTLVNQAVIPTPNNSFVPSMQNPYMYGNMAPPTPVVVPGTTVTVNTGPVEKRYCCSCCCCLFWIIVIVLIIGGLLKAAS